MRPFSFAVALYAFGDYFERNETGTRLLGVSDWRMPRAKPVLPDA